MHNEVKPERKRAYEKKHNEYLQICKECRTNTNPSRCEGCTNGDRLRWLESEYADVTGYSHEKWKG